MRLPLRRATRALGQQPAWAMIALAVDAVIAVTGILIGPGFTMTGLLAAGPLLACARCSGRVTALVAGYAIALCAIVAAATDGFRATMAGYRFGPVVVAGIFAVIAAVIRSRRESALIKISERVQRAILRPLPTELGGVAFASHYQSASSQALVGGDLYDMTMTQFGPRFIIGDVKGKGLDAVGRCAAVLAVFRELAFAEPDLPGLAEKMDARLSGEMEIEDFVTVILAEFAPGEVRMVNCGHHPPVKLAAGAGELQVMTAEEAAPPLGLHPCPARQDIALKPGDRLLFYTDGLVETRDRAGRFFALDDRVATALALPDLAPSALDGAVERVVRLLLAHAGGRLADDVLLVLCQPVEDLADPALPAPEHDQHRHDEDEQHGRCQVVDHAAGTFIWAAYQLYLCPIIANVVDDAHRHRRSPARGRATAVAGQEAVPADRHGGDDRRRDGRNDLGSALLRQDRLGAAR